VNRSAQACSNCYYVGRPQDLGAGYVCLRHPPQLQWLVLPQQQNVLDPKGISLQPTACGGWPNTEPRLWCGEWRPMESQ
jgi:hypothetical protein